MGIAKTGTELLGDIAELLVLSQDQADGLLHAFYAAYPAQAPSDWADLAAFFGQLAAVPAGRADDLVEYLRTTASGTGFALAPGQVLDDPHLRGVYTAPPPDEPVEPGSRIVRRSTAYFRDRTHEVFQAADAQGVYYYDRDYLAYDTLGEQLLAEPGQAAPEQTAPGQPQPSLAEAVQTLGFALAQAVDSVPGQRQMSAADLRSILSEVLGAHDRGAFEAAADDRTG